MSNNRTARAVFAALLALAGSLTAVAQDVKWKTPNLSGTRQPTDRVDSSASQPSPPRVLEPVAQLPFRPPPVDALPPPAVRSVVVPPNSTTLPSTLPPETIAPGPSDG